MEGDWPEAEHLLTHTGEREPKPRPPRPADPEGYFACLRLAPDATAEEVQRAYHGACQLYHPDRLYNASAETWAVATAHLQKINAAYFILSDPTRRLAYTQFGAQGTQLLQLIPQDIPQVFLLEALKGQQRCEDRIQQIQRQQPACSGTFSVEVEAHPGIQCHIVAPTEQFLLAAWQVLGGYMQGRGTQGWKDTMVDDVQVEPVSSEPLSGDPQPKDDSDRQVKRREAPSQGDAQDTPNGTATPEESLEGEQPTDSPSSSSSSSSVEAEAEPEAEVEEEAEAEEEATEGEEEPAEEPPTVVWQEVWWPTVWPPKTFAFVPPSKARAPQGWNPDLCPIVLRCGSEVIGMQPPATVLLAWLKQNRQYQLQHFPALQPSVALGAISLQQTVAAAVGQQCQVTLTGQTTSDGPCLQLQLTRGLATLRGSAGLRWGMGPGQHGPALLWSQTLSGVTVDSSLQLRGRKLPACSVTLSPVDLKYKGVTGSLELTAPAPAATLNLRGFKYREAAMATAVTVGVGQCRVRGTVSRSVKDDARTLLGTVVWDVVRHTWALHGAYQHQITESWAAGISILLNARLLRVILSIQHGQQMLKVPVTLAKGYGLCEMSTLASWVALGLAVGRLLWRPLDRLLGQRRRRIALQAARETLQEAHTKAMALQGLLRPKADAHRTAEQRRGGLVILQARYGCLDSACDEEVRTWMDVTVPCQAFVENSVLLFHSGPKSLLDGFCNTDPLGSGRKWLEIRYRHAGQERCAEFADDAPVRLPPLL